MRMDRRLVGSVCLALWSLASIVACGDDDEPADTPDGGPADSGTLDSGPAPDARPPDAGVPDGGGDPDAGVDPRYLAVVEMAEAQMAAQEIPGLSLAILDEGRLAFAVGLGVKRMGTDDPVTPETLFRIGSTQKMVTAATLLSLVDDGMLDLMAPVTDYVPSFTLAEGFDASTVTPWHLLTHSSGIPDAAPFTCRATLADYWMTARHPLWASPGRFFNYSNPGYSLAGLVAQTVDSARTQRSCSAVSSTLRG